MGGEGWLQDLEIQLDMLGHKNHYMALEQVLRVVEAKEARKISATCLLLPFVADFVTSSEYKYLMKSLPKDYQDCGRKGHGRKAPT